MAVYRAKMSMHGVKRGELFEADANDPRVLSGYAELQRPPEVPPAVAEALHNATEPLEVVTPPDDAVEVVAGADGGPTWPPWVRPNTLE